MINGKSGLKLEDHHTFQSSVVMNIFILKVVDLIDHRSVFLLRTINHYVTLIMCTLS